MTNGEKIKNALSKHRMSQKELANKIHVSAQAVSSWINGLSEPSKDNVESIRNVLGIEVISGKYGGIKHNKSIEFKFTNIENLGSVEKAEEEVTRIFQASSIKQNYSYPTSVLIEWLLIAITGLAYHDFINKKDTFEDYSGDIILCYLEDFFNDCYQYPNQYRNRLHYGFYIMGMDLFESFGEYKLPNHDYGDEIMAIWYKFFNNYDFEGISPIHYELKIALTELLYRFGR